MSLVGRKPLNHPRDVAARGADDEVDDRGTEPMFFQALSNRFGGFTVDVAAASHNALCERWYGRKEDGLAQPWAGERVWCNPPYSDCRAWVAKAWAERDADLIVMLLPANRTEQRWWHDLVEPYRDRPGSPLRVEFLPGRIRFIRPGAGGIGPDERPPFGCCLLIWEGPRTTGPSFEDLSQQARLL
jgi:phage N-6-adenine-methyltransferase